MIRLYAATVAALLALSGASFIGGKWVGYSNGVEHERTVQAKNQAKTQTELARLGEKLSRQTRALAELRREREGLVLELEGAAYDAPGGDNRGVGADGVRRLEQRWGSP